MVRRRVEVRSEDRRRLDRWLAVATVAIAVCLSAAGYGQARDVRALETRGVTAPGTIVGYAGSRNPSMIVEFSTSDGGRVRADTLNSGRDGDSGDPVMVVYDPRDPFLVRTADFGVDYTGAVALEILAVLVLVSAGIIWSRGVPLPRIASAVTRLS